MSRQYSYRPYEENDSGSSGFLFGLIIGLIIGAIIAILIYRNDKNKVIQTLKRKINKFILNLDRKTTPKISVKKAPTKSRKKAPKTFLVK
jgi:gas vesicle protein